MDPRVAAAREKYTVMKPQASEEGKTEFQKQLAANPFGTPYFHSSAAIRS